MKNNNEKPKKCGTAGFMNKNLTNEDNTSYQMGPIILELWRKCNGNRTVDELVKQMSEENKEIEHTPSLINEMLDLLHSRKLITYKES